MITFRLLCVVAVLVLATRCVAAEKYVICYYGTWATYRSGLGKFDVAHIDPSLCTHAVYTFAGLDDQGMVVSLDPWLDFPENWGRNNFGAFNALKQKNTQLKTLLAVGGWNFGSARFSIMAASDTLRRNFITSAIKIIQDHGFDGLDVDWEYPNRRDTVNGQADINNYTHLLKELREEFDKHGLFLSAAVSSVKDMASLSYDIPAISRYLDLMNVMTYDMYGAWDPVTGHNAALHRGEGDENANKEDLYTIDVALQYWLDQGAPPEKLAIGVPFYGRTFTLSNANNNSVRAPSSGAGIAGPYTASNGVIGYNEFCTKLQTESWTQKYDSLAKVPYAHSEQNWVSYDDADSITQKVQYAMKQGIAGIMVWSIETDDFHGLCGGGEYPLLKAINRAVKKYDDSTDASSSVNTDDIETDLTMPDSTIIPTSEVTPEDPPLSPSSDICTEDGFAADPLNCSSYYMCVGARDGSMRSWKFNCPSDLRWDQAGSTCNYPELVSCNT